ncbi:amidase [Poseidonocella sp. HB161398]|uniref:amidase n=1 Tax=Poseidonocella sp. HB161398 TaxID=2320855 RepID=UPI001109B171|nr:amidase [Poseidonocella sp. HB161398]
MTDPNGLSARALAAAVTSGRMTAEAVTAATLERVARANPAINAIVQDCGEEALAAAAALDARIAGGQGGGLLAGVPVTIKVISDQKGHATTNGLKAAAELVAEQDAPFLRRMRGEGALVVGRTNTPAFSYRWFTSNLLHGQTLNPVNHALTPGGSSGGAGAAVAAGLGHIGHGTDIAGSIRYPAYACGVQGLRPTVGRVPQFNATGAERSAGAQLMAVSGPIARRIDDLRLALEAMSGYDPEDPWSAPVPLSGPEVPRRVALVPRPDGMAVDPRILDDLDRAAAMFRAAGWEVDTPAAPPLAEAVELQTDLWLCDGYDGLVAAAEAEGDPGALTALGQFAERAKALDGARFGEIFRRRATLVRAWRRFLADWPVVLMPVSGELPFKAEEDLAGPVALARIWTAQMPQIALPVIGVPGLSVASGVEAGIPSGVQLVSAPWREDVALRAGEVLEAGFGIPELAG